MMYCQINLLEAVFMNKSRYQLVVLACLFIGIHNTAFASANDELGLITPHQNISSKASDTILLAEASTQQKNESQSAVFNKLLANAGALLNSGKPAEAYKLLIPHQSDYAGNENYDYLLGLAALDSGKPNEAIFALERVLAVNPGQLQARAEIARAYLAAGETSTSKQEFETVQNQNPPKEVSDLIRKYLDIIATGSSSKATSFQAYIETAIGNDSNVNTATSSSQIAIPYFGGIMMDLNSASVAKSDMFASIAAGFNVRHTLNDKWALVSGINVNQHSNAKESAYDNRNLDANFGASYTNGDNNYLAAIQAQSFNLNSKAYRNASGVTAQWQRNLLSGNQASLYLQYSNITYPDLTTNNVDRYILGGAYAMPLSGTRTGVIYIGTYGGSEAPQKSGHDNLGSSIYGIRTGGELKFTQSTTMLASASMEKRSYGGQEILFLKSREDTQTDFRVALGYVPAEKWTITPSLSYTSNDSNISLNKYDRTLLSITARRDFN
jgi:tetratricopeptide (TPR) repeat protein